MKRITVGFLIVVGLLAVATGVLYMNRPVVNLSSKYPPMELNARSKSSAVIVEGTVISRGASQRTRIPTTEPPGAFSEYPETPIKVRVDESIKGAKVGDVITYWEPGGEFLTEIVVTDVQPLQEGDKVILFLNKHGRSEGSPDEAALRVIDDMINYGHQGSRNAKEFMTQVRDFNK